MNNSKFLEISGAWSAHSDGHIALIVETSEGTVGYFLDQEKIAKLREALAQAEKFQRGW
jgi:hypothetical protein